MNSLDIFYSLSEGDSSLESRYDWCDCRSKLSTGAIVGIAVGGVALIVILIIIGYCVARSQRKTRLLY